MKIFLLLLGARFSHIFGKVSWNRKIEIVAIFSLILLFQQVKNISAIYVHKNLL